MDLESGYPFSLIRNGLLFNYPKLESHKTTDVVIIGGGISGALSAYYMVKKGISCILVDARSAGLGSTCASTSLLQYEIDTALHELIEQVGEKNAVRAYELCKESIDKLISIAKATGFKDIERKKSLYFTAAKKDVAFIKKEYEARKRNGFRVKLLEGQESEDYTNVKAAAAILSEDAAQTDAFLLTHHLHQYNIKRGLDVYDRSKVVRINKGRNGVTLQLQNNYTIKAKKVINATGYEVTGFLKKPIVKLQSTYALTTEAYNQPPSAWNRDLLLWNTADPYLYMRTTTDNRIIVGGRDEDFYSPVKRDKLLPQKTRQLEKDFLRLFPGNKIRHEFSWTGTFGSTKDGLPYIGQAGTDTQSYYALGFGGNGITFSVMAGEMLADLLSGKNNKDIKLFSFDR